MVGVGCHDRICGQSYFSVNGHGPRSQRLHSFPDTATFKVSVGETKGTFMLQESSPHHKRCYLSMCGRATCGGAKYGTNCIPDGHFRSRQYEAIRDWQFYKVPPVLQRRPAFSAFSWDRNIQLGNEYVIRNVQHNAFLGMCGHDCSGFGTAGYALTSARWAYPHTLVFKVQGPPPPIGYWKRVCQTRNGNCKFQMSVGVCSSSSKSVSSSVTNTLSATLGASIGFDERGTGLSAETTVSTTNATQNAYSSSKQTCSKSAIEATCDRVPTDSISAQYQWHLAVKMPNEQTVYVQSSDFICMSGNKPLRPRCPLGNCADHDKYCQVCK